MTRERFPAALLSLLALALVLIAPARGQLALPARAPDFVGGSPWVLEQPWDLETQSVNDNCATYPFLVPAAPADTLAVTSIIAPDYAYVGEVFVGSSAQPQQFVGGSWNMLSVAHRPNVIAGPGFNDPVCPIPWDGFPLFAPTAGASSNLIFMVWPYGSTPPPGIPAGQVTFRQEILAPSPLAPSLGHGPFQDSGYWAVEEWKTVNGTRAGRNYHELWLTPSTDPEMHWTGLGGNPAPYHSVGYGMHMEARMRIALWFVRASDVLANPSVIQ